MSSGVHVVGWILVGLSVLGFLVLSVMDFVARRGPNRGRPLGRIAITLARLGCVAIGLASAMLATQPSGMGAPGFMGLVLVGLVLFVGGIAVRIVDGRRA